MVAHRKPDFKSQWAMIVTVDDLDDKKRSDLKEFAGWFIETLRLEGAFIGHFFNYESAPVTIVESEPGNFESCTDAYQKIHNDHPQAVLVIHVLPHTQSNEYEWMKTLATRYGFIRQGILYDNCVNRFQNVDTEQNSVFRNMCQWIYRSGTAIVRNDGNSCGILHGKDSKPTFEKVLYNHEDIKDAVFKTLHHEDQWRGHELDNIVKISGYPDMLNAFGVAQLLSGYRVNGVSLTGPQSADVTLENKFQVFQAVQELNGKQLDRNHQLHLASTVSSSPAVDVVNPHFKDPKKHIGHLMGKLKVSQ